MKITACHYVKSIPDLSFKKDIPPKPEFVFIGRSNVGKSSLINFFSGKKQLARVSRSPGKTIYFNYYLINNDHYWVDAPGYGFAKVSLKERLQWEKAWANFIQNNKDIRCIFQLVDARISLQKADMEMMSRIIGHGKAWAIVLTKTESVSKKQLNDLAENIGRHIEALSARKVPCFFTSSFKKTGKEDALLYIEELLTP